MKQVIITGGRDYNDVYKVHQVLKLINPELVIQGGASGADRLAKLWAKANKKKTITVEAEWDKYGKAAGPRRNRKMIRENPNAIVIAFPGGVGTQNCIDFALKKGRLVIQVKE